MGNESGASDEEPNGAERPARAAAAQRQQQQARARSRTPAQKLARRQQLAASGSPASPRFGSAPADSARHEPAGAEQRLESLSALVREQQQQQANEHAVDQSKLDDVYILLAKKEKDLQLAAELGKVLLERNDELSKANERIAEEYSHKLELIEQEKHKLKRKLDQLDGEYENRLIELQTDCNILKNQLDQRDQSSRQLEKEKAKLIDDLVQQNQRLTRELAEATNSEELLSSQLEQLNERMNARMSNRLDQVAQVDALQDEIEILSQRKQDLERRLKLAQSDKLNLSAALDETGDKLAMMENLLGERESKLGELALEVNELRDSSAWLVAKLESMISLNERVVSQMTGGEQQSSALGGGSARELSERERSQLIEQLKELRLMSSSRIKASQELLLLSQHAANRGAGSRYQQRRQRRAASSIGSSIEEEYDEAASSASSDVNLARSTTTPELVEQVYRLLRRFQLKLQQRREHLLQQQRQQQQAGHAAAAAALAHQQTTNPNEDSGILHDANLAPVPTFAGGSDTADDWRQLLDSLRALIEEMPCSSCQLMIGERAELERIQKAHTKLADELKHKRDECLQLEALKLEHTSRLAALEERCQTLENDLEDCDTKPKEEIVCSAWRARDEAVARKNATEIALAKARIENMQISSQLMESVQQKGELSQRLAQFEDDIHYMTQRSVRHKFTWEELKADERVWMARKQRSHLNKATGQQSSTATLISNFGTSSIMQLLNSIGAPKEHQHQQQSSGDTTTSASSSSGHLDDDSGSGQSPTSTTRQLLASIKANKFNLKFWQPTKQTEVKIDVDESN